LKVVNGCISCIRKAGCCFIIACLLFFNPGALSGAGPDHSPSIRFLGAARTIGGSASLIDTGHLRLLLDFGSFPDGKKRDESLERSFDPASIDYVLLTHAHADHAGRIPLLYRWGFKGRVIGTDATRSLLRITLAQSLTIMEERGAADYDRADVERMLKNYLVVPYGQKISLSADVSLRLRNAGHILGSAIFELWFKDRNGPIKIVASGDMGSGVLSLLPPPAILDQGDYILVESTYGPFRQGETDDRRFGNEVRNTLRAGGSVLIPAFTLDRTQKVLYVLGRLK
jgi:metallo-beta-lactamase family protein